jgi:hypothetical protein
MSVVKLKALAPFPYRGRKISGKNSISIECTDVNFIKLKTFSSLFTFLGNTSLINDLFHTCNQTIKGIKNL